MTRLELSPETLRRVIRWNRRKATTGRYSQRGYVGGNVRYSGKGGNGGRPDTRAHKQRQGAL